MKSRAVLSAALVAGVLYFAAAASSVQAFDLLDRMMTSHGGCGCEAAPSCCEPDPCCQKRVGLLQRLHARHHSCCEPACGVEVACGVEAACCDPCHDCCAPKRPSLLDRIRASRHHCAPACDPKCGVDPHCGVEPTCCDPCAPKRPGLLTRLFSCRTSCAPACDPKCGVEPTCCH
jgi:hypothetical protein